MDPYPSASGPTYGAPSNIKRGLGVDELGNWAQRQLTMVASALTRYPALSVNLVQPAWVPGPALSLVGGTPPTTGQRGVYPVAVYGSGAAADGGGSFRVCIPGVYQLRVFWGEDTPGTGIVRWDITTNVIATEPLLDSAGAQLYEVPATGTGESSGVSVVPTGTDNLMGTPLSSLRLSEPCIVGFTLSRDPTTAPDTGTADAFVLGVSLERQGDL